MSSARRLLLGLIGAGIGRSLTPELHEAEAEARGLDVRYQLIDTDRRAAGTAVESADALLAKLLFAARTMGFGGLNITFPFKQTVLAHLDELSDEARDIGAVNTIVFEADGRLVGHNTDGIGWRRGFERALPDADLSRVVLLGAGGAGSAIADALMRMGAPHLVVADVDVLRASALARSLVERHGIGRATATVAAVEFASANDGFLEALERATGLVNATPIGMEKSPGLPLPAGRISAATWVSDAVYIPLRTALLEAARAKGCRTVDGGGMALGQATAAFRLFTGLEPDEARMESHLLRMLAERDQNAAPRGG